METKKLTKILSVSIIIAGVFTLLWAGTYNDFAKILHPLNKVIVFFAHLFTVTYGVSCVYCGVRMMRFEDWARRTVLVMMAVDIFMTLGLFRISMDNLRAIIVSGDLGVPPQAAEYIYYVSAALAVMFTVFEAGVIIYFTRPKVVSDFHIV